MAGRLYKPAARLTIYRPGGESFFSEPSPNAIVIGGENGTGLRVAFDVEKTLSSEPNKSAVIVSNLNEGSRRACADLPLCAILEGGYDGERHRLLRGDVTWADTSKDGGTWNTTLLVADGGRALQHARTSTAYRNATSVVDMVMQVAADMMLAGQGGDYATMTSAEREAERRRLLNDAAKLVATKKGAVLDGRSRDVMDRLLRPYGYRWSVQDRQLVVLGDGTRAGRVWPVDKAHGMKCEPERAAPDKDKKQKVTIQCALYPQLEPGVRVRLTSRKLSGDFRVERVRHSGDTESAESWTTEIECRVK